MGKNILDILEQKAPAFSKGQKRIARYILSDLRKVAFLTAGALAKETEVSESTVVRFAAELGYDGFPQMQKALQDALMDRFGDGAPIPSKIQMEGMETVARALCDARRIYLIAKGEEKILAAYMGNCLEKHFPDIHILFENSGKLQFIGAEDAAVVFSFSPYCRETEEMAAFCHNAGAKVIGITSSDNSPICKSCHESLFVKGEQMPWGLSLTRPMGLVDQLLHILIPGKIGENTNEI